MTRELVGLVATVAREAGLTPSLVRALVEQESDGYRFALNAEPRYRYLWNVKTRAPFRPLTSRERVSEEPPLDFPSLYGDPDQEWWLQQCSIGLMQIMGALARELGCRAPSLLELVEARPNLELGCLHLRRLLAWSGGDVRRALAAYNGGKAGNTREPLRTGAYADAVLARMPR